MTEDEFRCKIREGFDRCIAKGDAVRQTHPEQYQETVRTALDYYAEMLREDDIQHILCELINLPFLQIVDEEYKAALGRIDHHLSTFLIND